MKLNNFSSFLKSLVYPKSCPFCHEIIDDSKVICDGCKDNIYLIGDDVCQFCARDVGNCSCKKDDYNYDSCIASIYYKYSIKDGIHNFKFRDYPEISKIFAKFIYDDIIEKYSDYDFDIMTSVPMNITKRHKRGYNQSDLISKYLSNWLDIEYVDDILIKKNTKKSQRELSAKERKENIKNKIIFNDTYSTNKIKSILLIDDVLTTGSTLNECARVLKDAGIGTVRCAVISATAQN